MGQVEAVWDRKNVYETGRIWMGQEEAVQRRQKLYSSKQKTQAEYRMETT